MKLSHRSFLTKTEHSVITREFTSTYSNYCILPCNSCLLAKLNFSHPILSHCLAISHTFLLLSQKGFVVADFPFLYFQFSLCYFFYWSPHYWEQITKKQFLVNVKKFFCCLLDGHVSVIKKIGSIKIYLSHKPIFYFPSSPHPFKIIGTFLYFPLLKWRW